MDFLIPNQVTLTDLRGMLQYLPQTPENRAAAEYLLDLIRAKEVTAKPYIYTHTVAALVGGGIDDGTMDIANDSDFLVFEQTYSANVGNAAQTVSDSTNPLCDVLIQNNAGDQLMDASASLTSLFGTGLHPRKLAMPWRLSANSSIPIKVTNLTAGTTYNLKLHFHGVKLSRARG